ncbi:MAG: hypothetical protein HFJ50_05580 [Clostridia bacterium]|nr:hypothetical protein [Clostridia bacterium]
MEENKRKTKKAKKEKVIKEKKENPIKPILNSETLNILRESSVARLFAYIVSAVLLLVSLNIAYDHTKETIGDGAYKYDEGAYEYINESIKNYLGEDGPSIALLQENIPKWTSSYENGETILVCTLQDGFFCAEVTARITKDFKLIETTRNFNSLEEYQDYFWHTVRMITLENGLIIFGIISIVLFTVCELMLLLLSKFVCKKEEAIQKSAYSATENVQNDSATEVQNVYDSDEPIPATVEASQLSHS